MVMLVNMSCCNLCAMHVYAALARCDMMDTRRGPCAGTLAALIMACAGHAEEAAASCWSCAMDGGGAPGLLCIYSPDIMKHVVFCVFFCMLERIKARGRSELIS